MNINDNELDAAVWSESVRKLAEASDNPIVMTALDKLEMAGYDREYLVTTLFKARRDRLAVSMYVKKDCGDEVAALLSYFIGVVICSKCGKLGFEKKPFSGKKYKFITYSCGHLTTQEIK